MGQRGRRAQEEKSRIAEAKPKPMCAYCGTRPGREREHVVASCFFNTLTNNEVTVPGCSDCNRGRGDGGPRDIALDEEYVRNVFCLNADMGDHPVASQLRDGAVMRSFKNSPGLRHRVMKTVKWAEPRTPAGLYLPKKPSYTIELDRIERVTKKIVRGLFYAKEKRPLPPDILIEVAPAIVPEEFLKAANAFRQPVNEWTMLGKNVLRYKAARVGADEPDCFRTQWMFVWYNCHVVMAATGPRGDAI